MSIEQKIINLKLKLENQIEKEESYKKIYKTSNQIDKLLVQYYKIYGLSGIK